VKARLIVDPIACTGHGLCAELLPEWITLDDWGFPIIDPRVVPPDLEALAKHAVEACPTLALALRQEARQPHRA
jgi:ferredoxin